MIISTSNFELKEFGRPDKDLPKGGDAIDLGKFNRFAPAVKELLQVISKASSKEHISEIEETANFIADSK